LNGIAGYRFDEIGNTGYYVVKELGNVADAYLAYLNKLSASAGATTAEINAAAARWAT